MAKYKHNPGKRPPPTPKKIQPWHPLPAPAKGEPVENVLYAAIGRALSAWSKIEQRIAFAFSHLLVGGHETNIVAIRAFGSVVSFKSRADMFEAMAAAHFHDFPNDKLAELIKAHMILTRGWSERRNELAHGYVTEYALATGHRGRTKHEGFVLVPALHSTSRRKLDHEDYKLTVRSVGDTTPKAPIELVGRWTILQPAYIYGTTEVQAYEAGFDGLDPDWELISDLSVEAKRRIAGT